MLGGLGRIPGALLVQHGLMSVALSGRLLWTDGSGAALAVMIGGLSVAAVAVGLRYRGRSWCHFVCPVGLVEKVYLEPTQLAEDATSQCSPCSACTKHCEDIQGEQGYWKRAQETPRRTAHFAWPGVLLAFHGAFWLQAGTWDRYCRGAWTRSNLAWDSAGIAGVPLAPWSLVAPLVLIGRGALSYALALAGFVAFILFYAFAGQPTLRLAPQWLPWLLGTLVVLRSAASLFRRWPRTEADFVRERFATRLRNRWKWDEQALALDTSSVVLVHKERTRAREARLQAYRDTLTELTSAGTLTRADLETIHLVQRQFGRRDTDHVEVLKRLEDDQRELFDESRIASAEQDLELRHLRQELEDLVAITVAAGTSPDPKVLKAAGADLAPDLRVRPAASSHLDTAPDPIDPADLAGRSTLAAATRALPHGAVDPALRSLLELRQVALFQSLDPPHLQELADRVRPRDSAPSEALCIAEQTGDQVCVVLTGQAQALARRLRPEAGATPGGLVSP